LRSSIKRSRLWSYSVLLLGAALAGLLGAGFDQVTVSISPDYFTLGKGLPEDALRLRVAWLGFRSALPLGALVSGLGLIYASRTQRHVWRGWLAPILLALIVTLPASALTMVVSDPFDVRSSSAGSLTQAACTRYLLAWGLHVGAYGGIVLGLAITLVRARRQRGTGDRRSKWAFC
jgi:hypothetical protein